MPTANASEHADGELPRTRVELKVPTDASRRDLSDAALRSGPSAFAVGMHRTVAQNRSALGPPPTSAGACRRSSARPSRSQRRWLARSPCRDIRPDRPAHGTPAWRSAIGAPQHFGCQRPENSNNLEVIERHSAGGHLATIIVMAYRHSAGRHLATIIVMAYRHWVDALATI